MLQTTRLNKRKVILNWISGCKNIKNNKTIQNHFWNKFLMKSYLFNIRVLEKRSI